MSTWNASLEEANQYLKPEDAGGNQRFGGYKGIRLGKQCHPGPLEKGRLQPRSCGQFRLRFLNCGGPNGAWAMFADCCQYTSPQVIALQETRLSATEEAAFIRHAQKYMGSSSTLTPWLVCWTGGLVVVSCSWWIVAFDFGNLHGVPLKTLELRQSGSKMLTFYAPPDRSKDCQQQASEHLQECLL